MVLNRLVTKSRHNKELVVNVLKLIVICNANRLGWQIKENCKQELELTRCDMDDVYDECDVCDDVKLDDFLNNLLVV